MTVQLNNPPDLSGLVPYVGATTNVNLGLYSITGALITGTSLIKSGGTSSQFLKADGTVDSSVYLTAIPNDTYVAVSGNYSILTTDNFIAASGTGTDTLPTAVGVTGKSYTIKNVGTGVITIATTSAQTIDGVTTYVIRTTNSGITVLSNGANWLIKAVV
jgi:hypothetical protein